MVNLYPLITSLFLSFIFEKILKIKVDNNMPFFIFIYSGIIYWSLFEQGINLAKNSLVWNRELVTKTAFPKETLPFSFIFSKITDLDMNPKNCTLTSLGLLAIRFHVLKRLL